MAVGVGLGFGTYGFRGLQGWGAGSFRRPGWPCGCAACSGAVSENGRRLYNVDERWDSAVATAAVFHRTRSIFALPGALVNGRSAEGARASQNGGETAKKRRVWQAANTGYRQKPSAIICARAVGANTLRMRMLFWPDDPKV